MPSNLHLDGNSLTYDVTTATGTTTETFNGTFTDFQALQSKLNVDVDDTKGFTMTNAPLTKGQSGTSNPQQKKLPTTLLRKFTQNAALQKLL